LKVRQKRRKEGKTAHNGRNNIKVESSESRKEGVKRRKDDQTKVKKRRRGRKDGGGH